MPEARKKKAPAGAQTDGGPSAREEHPECPEDALIAEVAPAAPTSGGEGVFDYAVPSDLADRVQVGVRLVVPLQGRPVEGYCLRLKASTDVGPDRLKNVLDVVDPRPVYPPALLDLAVWTGRRYLCRPGEVLRTAVPSQGRFRPRERARLAVGPEEAAAALEALPATARVQAAVLRELLGGLSEVTALRRRVGPGLKRALAALRQKGLVGPEEGPVRPGPRRAPRRPGVAGVGVAETHRSSAGPTSLTRAQAAALAAIADDLKPMRESADPSKVGGRVFLLHGVTGSGKTEVYLRAAGETLACGRQVLVLVPEVSLVPQTLDRVRSHLGTARVAVAHSYMGGRERLDNWEQILGGAADVVVGARSAVFAPLGRLGLIILDEEHEDSYKQDQGAPRYHAREVAVRRSCFEGAVLLLASATPSLEAYHRALQGEYTLLSLSDRVGSIGLPPVEVVDMRQELKAGNRSVFSRALQAALAQTMGLGRQAILFLNRRGHSTFVLCRDCGWVARCPNCDVALIYHDPRADLLCHYCGHHFPAASQCPACGGHRVRYFGAGTQRIEDEARLLFPAARIARLDTDVVQRPGEAARVLAMFASGQTDVLVGTQMVAKGLDVPGVGLVAAVSADSALHLPDFRAGEKTFRLLTQAGGRAGRGDKPGRVIIQTYNPTHPAVTAAARHDYRGFAAGETESRRLLGYPPHRHLIRVEFTDANEAKASGAATIFTRRLSVLGFSSDLDPTRRAPGPRFAGPSVAPLGRLRGRHRWHVLVFCSDLEEGLAAVKDAVLQATGRQPRGGGRGATGGPVASVDVDPVSVL